MIKSDIELTYELRSVIKTLKKRAPTNIQTCLLNTIDNTISALQYTMPEE